MRDRLDAAITEAKRDLQGAICEVQLEHEPESAADDALDHYAALVALRARYEEHELEDRRHTATWCSRCEKLEAEAERLLGEDA